MTLLARQVRVLTSKNLSINLRRQWLSTPLRAFLLPVLLVVLLAFSRNLLSPSAQFGIGVSHPVPNLSQALSAISATRDRVLFVNNGFDNGAIDHLIANVIKPLNVTDVEFKTLRSAGSLQAECRSSSQGTSRCIAVVIFHSSPSEGAGGIWNYTMRADGALGLNIDVESDSNDAQLFVFPLQHAIDFAIAQHESVGGAEPTVYDYPFTSLTNAEREEKAHSRYMGNVISILAVAFYIALVGVLYHLTGAMAAERESGMAQLLDVMMANKRPWEPQAARLASHHLAFAFLYAPGWIAMGAILGAIAFTKTSIAMSIISNIFCGLSLTSFALLAGSCFKESQLSGVTAVISSLVLAIIAQVARDAPTWVTGVLAFLFPPSNYIYLIIAIARWERVGAAADALRSPPDQGFSLPIFAFLAFAVLHMILYPLLAATVERSLHGTKSASRRLNTLDSPVAVRLSNCTKTYRPSLIRRLLARATGSAGSTITAINNLSLEVYRGELTVLLGTNGSGKSTTLDAVAGMHSLDSGVISLSYTGSQGRSGHCPQKNVLWDELTVEEHAKIFDGIKRVSGKSSREDIQSLIKACDLSAKAKTCSKDLSGGQKRKLQLVLMFSGDSDICCVDEVSSGVDPLSRRKLWDILLSERDRRTIILSTHFLDEADVLADRIAIMSRGSLRAQGTSAELKQRMTHGYRVHVHHRAVASHQPCYEDIPHLDTDGEIVYFPGTSSETAMFLRRLEGDGISEYEVSSPTLEEVFLNVAADTGHRPGTEGGRASQESRAPLVDVRFSKPLPRTQELFGGRPPSLARQCRIMFMKRLTIFRRNYAPYMIATILPVIAAGCATLFLKKVSPASCNPDIATLSGSSGSESISPQTFRLVTGPEDQLSAAARAQIASAPPGSVTYVKTLQEFNLEVSRQAGNLTPGGFFLGDSPTFAWRADGPLVYGHILQNLLDVMILNMTIASDYQPLDVPFTANIGNLLIFVAIAGFSMAMYPAFLILYPTAERLRGIRSMQYSNGVAVTPLWLSYLAFDFLVTLIVASISAIVFQAVTGVWYYLGYLFLILLLYGVAATLFAYALSSRAKSQLGAFAFCAAIQCASFLVFFVTYLVTLTYTNPATQSATLTTAFYVLGAVSPVCNLARALYLALNMFGITCRGRELAPYPGAMDVYGGPILYLCLQSLLLFAIVLLEDSGLGLKQWLRRPRKVQSSSQGAFELEPASGPHGARSSSKTGLEVIGLTKQFKHHLAVDDVSFNAPKNECFALLGPNGAGKTTCISMIRGDILPSNPKSEVLVEGISAIRHRSHARHKLGVCPQIDPLDKMTVREHLDFYARVRGVSDPAHNVDVVLASLGLREFADRVAYGLSGGNKRKLSLGIALMGNPSVLVLDEPSSGMDAASMRLMWRILSSVTPGRSLILTTHSMEEADALATRAGIVAGKMLACGTIQDLRSQYADRFLVHLVHQNAPHASDATMGEIRRWIHHQFPGAHLQANGAKHGQIRFELSREVTNNTTNGKSVTTHLAGVFECIEMFSARLGIEYYSVSRMTLEQVFLGVLEAHNAHLDS